MRRTLTIAVVVALVLVAGGVAFATIPDGNGVIHGCYNNANGALRVVDGTSCSGNETALTWSQTGPQGPTGATGATGAQGDPLQFYIASAQLNAIAGTATWQNVACDSGDVAVGGGYQISGPSYSDIQVIADNPNSSANLWTFAVTNSAAETRAVVIMTRCADYSPLHT